MKSVLTGAFCAIVLAGTSGCSGNYAKAEEATKEMLDAMNEIAAALESIQSPETAKIAAPKIEAAVDKLAAGQKKVAGLKVTKSEDEKLTNEYKPKLEAAAARMQKVAFQAGMKSQGEPTFKKALEKMQTLKP